MDKDIDKSSISPKFQNEVHDDLLSIVIPCYNDHAYITTAVNSALHQTWEPKEIILVDDGSSIRTKEVLNKLKSEKLKIVTQNNKGTSAARNIGIEKARGKYILVLDSDDYFDTKFSQKAIDIINSQPDVKIITCYGRWFISDNNSVIHKPAGGNINNFLYECGAFGSVLFLKKDWKAVDGYDEQMKLGYEDWEFYIRLLEPGGKAIVIPEILFHYRNKENSRNSWANNKKYEIWKYIFLKHSKHYREDFEKFVTRITFLLQNQEDENRRLRNKPDFRLGHFLLFPFRKIKHNLFSR